MKDRKLIEEVRKRAFENRNGLYVPRTEGDVKQNWPVCQTCRRDVESVELKEQNSFGVVIWARCHGKEDYYKVVYPYRIDESDEEQLQAQIRTAMNAFLPFQTSIVL